MPLMVLPGWEGSVVLTGRGRLGRGGGLLLWIGAARDAVIVEAVPVLLRRRAARTRVGDRYQGGNKQHDRDRHQGELPAGDAAGQGCVDPCRIWQPRMLVPAG